MGRVFTNLRIDARPRVIAVGKLRDIQKETGASEGFTPPLLMDVAAQYPACTCVGVGVQAHATACACTCAAVHASGIMRAHACARTRQGMLARLSEYSSHSEWDGDEAAMEGRVLDDVAPWLYPERTSKL